MKARPALRVLIPLTASMALAGCCRQSHSSNSPSGNSTPGSRLINQSPFAAETGVALFREVELYFDAELAPASVNSTTIQVRDDGVPLRSRVHLGADRKHVKVFPDGEWPSGRELEAVIDGTRLRTIAGTALDLDGDGLGGEVFTFGFRTSNATRSPGTHVVGRVFASSIFPPGEDPGLQTATPIAGVLVSVIGASDANATTDAQGNFVLQDVPEGEFFVHVDGVFATGVPSGIYYPNVGKAWNSIAGRTTDIGTVFLPAIAVDTLQLVSRTEETSIAMTEAQLAMVPDPTLREQLRSVRVIVPADSLYWDNGNPGEMVGIAPVNPDRLPAPLPEDLAFPLVFTVQTDGAQNFDRPVAVTLPNLSVPPLAPGAKTSLWSFNHDTGRFEVVGSMTVSEDGATVTTDPGSGIRAPGWHGVSAGTWLTTVFGIKCSPTAPCVIQHNCYLIRDMLGLAGSTFECAGYLRLKGSYRRILGFGAVAADRVATIAEGLLDYRSAMERGESHVAQRERIRVLANGSALVVEEHALYEAFKNNNLFPGDSLGEIAVGVSACANTFYATLNTLCRSQGVNFDDDDEMSPHCRSRLQPKPDSWLNQACAVTGQASELASLASSTSGLVSSYLETDRLARVVSTVEFVLALHEFLEAEEREMTPGEFADLAASIDALSQSIANARAEADALRAAMERIDQNLTAIESTMDRLLAEQRRNADPSPGTLHYSVETLAGSRAFPGIVAGRPLVQRGVTNDRGVVSINTTPDSELLLGLFDPVANRYSETRGYSSGNGARTLISPQATRSAAGLPDADGDGLADLVERIVGTRADLADTDLDGVEDLAELLAGTDPTLGLRGSRTSVGTPSPASDLAVHGQVAVVANGNRVSTFNVFEGMSPIRVADLELGHPVLDVACADGYAAAALGDAGVAVLDVRDLAQPRLLAVVQPGEQTTAVTMEGTSIYAGSHRGTITLIDAPSASTVTRLSTTATPDGTRAILDMVVRGRVLYAVDSERLFAVDRFSADFRVVSSQSARFSRSPLVSLFADIDDLYVVRLDGFDVWSLSDPLFPQRDNPDATGNVGEDRGWKQLVTNGSGLLVAAVGTDASLSTGPHRIGLFDNSVPGVNPLEYLATGAKARAVQIHCGIAYVADDTAGLTAMRIVDADRAGRAPTAQLDFGSQPIVVGQPFVCTVDATDDVQVRHVELLRYGNVIARDCSHPFEFRLRESASGPVSYSARAVDMAGNATLTPLHIVTPLPDTIAPRVLRTRPRNQSVSTASLPITLAAWFDEELDPATVDASTFLVRQGSSGIPPLEVQYRATERMALLRLPSVAPGEYTATLTQGIRDASGNALEAPVSWSFVVADLRSGLDLHIYNLPFHSSSPAAGTILGEIDTFYSRVSPSWFTSYAFGRAPFEALEATVPNPNFPSAGGTLGMGRFLAHAGLDGVDDTGDPEHPQGDDMTFANGSSHQPGGMSSFGFLLEGYLYVPVSGTAQFEFSLDDGYRLELDGVFLDERLGTGNGTRLVPATGTMQLAQGFHHLRIAGFNAGGFSVHIMRFKSGTAFPLGADAVIPVEYFWRR